MISSENVVAVSLISVLLIIIVVAIIIIVILFCRKLKTITKKAETYKPTVSNGKRHLMSPTRIRAALGKSTPTRIRAALGKSTPTIGKEEKKVESPREQYQYQIDSEVGRDLINSVFDGINKDVIYQDENAISEVEMMNQNRIDYQKARDDALQMNAVHAPTPAEARQWAVEQNYIYTDNNDEALPKELITSLGISAQIQQGAVAVDNLPFMYTMPMSNNPNSTYNANNALTEKRNIELNGLAALGQIASNPIPGVKVTLPK